MRYAHSPQWGDRIEPTPGDQAFCPICWGGVRAKCGRINAWHWAHLSQEECDPWAEPDSTWHRGWQEVFPATAREVTIGRHRADVRIPGGILELQHSHLPVDQIWERESFYGAIGHFAWLFDVTEPFRKAHFLPRYKEGDTSSYCTFRWKHGRKTLGAANATVYLDLGPGILKLGKMYTDDYVSGWGHLWTRNQFLAEFASACYYQQAK